MLRLVLLQTQLVTPGEIASNIGRWLFLAALVGLLSGSASAVFLLSLDFATELRDSHLWLIAFLPLAGFAIGYVYHHYGAKSSQGNNLLLEALYHGKDPIPLRMTPLVLFGTIFTHLFGGSAGREGTAVQMGGSLADQLTKWFSLHKADRRIVIICGVSGGFASVFGTPLAGAVFSLEWMLVRKLRWRSIPPAFFAAFVADWICEFGWGVGHTHYFIPEIPSHSQANLAWVIPAGIAFGFSARLFAETAHVVSAVFKKTFAYPPLRPLVGGVLIALLVYLSGTTTYIGLGVPRIVEAFETPLPWYDWLAKTGLTGLTLGSGFKGGEVTPLFFTGATLGNALSAWIPLPLALLAGMGFVGVFSGATNTPMACTVMGMELFGYEAGVFLGIACLVAYFFSGKGSIYASQNLEAKYLWRL
ncbi:voltage-gated chloride channel family protein [Algoriphagus aestuariicola]|uniref:Voltage-gated chloride channel family protein n=1 Tax=Algoriphagus aestuariicola TaxID=1852016 RepID=A0ABS3BSL0_9BACT|nr:voltage-gated chloride channel family protein [Algoriphagus aestuariicola]